MSVDYTKITKHKFEIPWNGDYELVDALEKHELKEKIDFIYMPCARSDAENTRKYSAVGYDRDGFEATAEYIELAGFSPCVLFQRDANLDSLPYYYDFGIRKFIVGEDKTARFLRERYGEDVTITASITKDLLEEDYVWYSQNEPDLYTNFVLKFSFSKDIEGVANLPKNLKYTIMPNSCCIYNCPIYRLHWFPEKEESFGKFSKRLPCEDGTRNSVYDRITINPEDLWIFDPYVYSYKLVDRLATTENILKYYDQYVYADVDIKRDLTEEELKIFNLAHGKQTRNGDPIY